MSGMVQTVFGVEEGRGKRRNGFNWWCFLSSFARSENDELDDKSDGCAAL